MSARDDLVRRFLDAHPGDAARLLEDQGAGSAAALLDGAAPEPSSKVLRHMAPGDAADCVMHMDRAAAARALSAMPLDAAAALLRRVRHDEREALLDALPRQIAEPLRRLLRYPDDTAGALMDPLVMALPADLPAGEAVERVRRSARHALYYVYVVDGAQRLVGVMNLREMMLAPPDEPLSAQMRSDLVTVRGDADRLQIMAHGAWRRLHALPVVDRDGTFLGAIRYETMRSLEDEVATPAGSDAMATAASLGELCWIGMAGVVAGLATTLARPQTARPMASPTAGPTSPEARTEPAQ